MKDVALTGARLRRSSQESRADMSWNDGSRRPCKGWTTAGAPSRQERAGSVGPTPTVQEGTERPPTADPRAAGDAADDMRR